MPPRARAVRIVLAALVAAALASCSLTSLDGFSGGADAADGGSVRDATLDHLGSNDAPASNVDAGPDVDAQRPDVPFCAGQAPPPFFCADFDEGALTKVFQAGALKIIPAPLVSTGCTGTVGSAARSAPGALLAELAAGDAGTLYVRYNQPLSAAATGQTLQFDMQLLGYKPGQEIDFASVTFEGANDPKVRVYIDVQASGKGNLAVYNGATYQYGIFDLPADGQWHTYRLEVDLGPLHSQLFVDDAQVADVSHTATFTTTPQASFYLGPAVYPPSALVRLAMDNVLVRLR